MSRMDTDEHSVPPRQQIANLLVAVFSRSDANNGEMPGLTHEAIAAMAGVSRPTVSKVLHDFRSLGLIAMQYGNVPLLDSAALRAVARMKENGCMNLPGMRTNHGFGQ